MMDVSNRTPPGVSPLDYGAGSLATAASGNPSWLAMILGRPLARETILSRPYQALMGQPNLNDLSRSGAMGMGMLSGQYGQNR